MIDPTLHDANELFYDALNAILYGDTRPMRDVWSHAPDVTNMGPFGGCLSGFDAVVAQFAQTSRLKLGGRVLHIDVHVVAGSDVGYAVCVERGENMRAAGQPIHLEHRATNVFRREHGSWKLVHHHADLSPALQEHAGPML
jgi:ketosteroid isomerase-like protein